MERQPAPRKRTRRPSLKFEKEAACVVCGVDEVGCAPLAGPVVAAAVIGAVAALWLAMAIIVALIAAVTVTVLYFGPISRTAGLLLLPYIAWLVFASTLNWWAAVHN